MSHSGSRSKSKHSNSRSYTPEKSDRYRRDRADQVRARGNEPVKHVDPDVAVLKVSTPGLLRFDNKQYIYEFDPTVLHTRDDGKRIAIIGASGSGKSRLALELMRFHKNIPAWMILNPSEPANHMYGPYVESEALIHDHDDVKVLVEALYQFKQRQIKRCKEWSIPGTDPVRYHPDPSAGCIIDDMCEDPKIFNDPIFGWLMCNSRNFKSWVIFLVQYAYFLPKKFRRQLSHIFLFAMRSTKDIKTMWEEFGSVFDKFEDFKRAFLMATKNRGTLVIDMRDQSGKIEGSIFWYRHQFKQPPFKLGQKWFNDQVKQRYNPAWENDYESDKKVQSMMAQQAKMAKEVKNKKPIPLDIELK